MLDRKEALQRWRARMLERGVIQEADIEELENHLLEQSDELQASGLSGEEAFLIAARRLGDADTLTEEYRKVNQGALARQRLFWLAVVCACLPLGAYVLSALNSIAALGYRLVVPTPEKFGYWYFLLAAVVCATATLLLGGLTLKIRPGLVFRLPTRPLLLLLIVIGGSISLRLIGFVSDMALDHVAEGDQKIRIFGEAVSWITIPECRSSAPGLINKATWECLYLILLLALSVLLHRLQPASSPRAVG